MEIVKDIIKPCCDWQRRTCLQVDRQDDGVKYIELDSETGLEVRVLPASQFDKRFQPIVDYPPARACQLYSEYARQLGATEDALIYLRAFANISEEDFEMAKARKPGAIAQPAAAAKKTTAVKAAKAPKAPAKKAPAKKAPAKKAAAAAKPRGETASAMFRELILRGTMTDDTIFAKVQEKFGLDDNKRSYVAWYRNSLKKQGVKVPDPK